MSVLWGILLLFCAVASIIQWRRRDWKAARNLSLIGMGALIMMLTHIL